MVGLQTKVNQYEREVQQLKRALARSDSYIEELTSKLNKPAAQKNTAKSRGARPSSASTASSCTVTTLLNETEGTDAVEGNAEEEEFPARPASAPGQVFASLASNSSPELRSRELPRRQEKKQGGGSRRNSQISSHSGQETESSAGSPGAKPDMLSVSDKSPSLGGETFDSMKDTAPKNPAKRLVDEDLDVFTASRKLMLLSERVYRQRTGEPSDTTRVRAEVGESSPCSSDSGGRGMQRTLDFEMLVEAANSPQIPVATPQNQPSPVPSSEINSNVNSGEESPEVTNTFSLAKIKTEITTPCDDDSCPLKKVKLEKGDSSELD